MFYKRSWSFLLGLGGGGVVAFALRVRAAREALALGFLPCRFGRSVIPLGRPEPVAEFPAVLDFLRRRARYIEKRRRDRPDTPDDRFARVAAVDMARPGLDMQPKTF